MEKVFTHYSIFVAFTILTGTQLSLVPMYIWPLFPYLRHDCLIWLLLPYIRLSLPYHGPYRLTRVIIILI